MRNRVLLLAITLLQVVQINAAADSNRLTLWYDKPVPATSSVNLWEEYSLPIGNGQLGASIMGGVAVDDVQFNEKTLYTGRATDNGKKYGAYQNFGNLIIENLGDTVTTNYRRQLDIEQALATVCYDTKNGKSRYRRTYFTSAPDSVIVVRYECLKGKKLSLRIKLRSGSGVATTYGGSKASFNGSLETICYQSAIQVENEGGNVFTEDGNYIVVEKARAINIYLSAVTNFDPHSPTFTNGTLRDLAQTTQRRCHNALGHYKDLYARHIADYKALFDRCRMRITESMPDIPTDQLIEACMKDDTDDNYRLALEQLYFNYGRYLLISSSRGVELPSNLQGIWNNTNSPAWNCDIHSNINVQMNYWPAEPTNLSELHLPYLYYIHNMALLHPQWQEYAKEQGQTVGWTCFTENNIFGGVGDFMHEYTIANAWYSTHLWQHYRYTLNRQFLRDVALPVMESACRYWMERLVKDSDGLYVCPNEYSPEQGPVENGTAHAQQLVCELFANTIEACEIEPSVCSRDFVEKLKETYRHTDNGLRIEIYDGRWGTERIAAGTPILREWKYSPFSAGQHNHRHQSHLMCLYPFNQVTPADSALFEAAVNSLRLRGDESTGWSMAWRICLWARAEQGDRAEKILRRALQHSQRIGGVYYNLYDSHPPFQIDGNFGATAGMTEMLLQSYRGEIHLLPALPTAWAKGEVDGLKAEGGVSVSETWNNHKLQSAKLTSSYDTSVKLCYNSISRYDINGGTIDKSLSTENAVMLHLKAGEQVKITYKR